MLYREIIAFCYEIHTKYITALCGQNIEFFIVKPGGTYSDRPNFEWMTLRFQLQNLRSLK